MRALVTGAAGFISSHLVDRLLAGEPIPRVRRRLKRAGLHLHCGHPRRD